MSLFNGPELIKTKELGGTTVFVGCYNGSLVAAIQNGKVTIMNESLGVIKEFDGTKSSIQSLCGNSTYSAVCDNSGSVQYCKRNGDMETKVIFLYFYRSNLFQIYKHDGKAKSIQIKNNLIISGSHDKTVQVWNMERHEQLWQSDYGDKVWSVVLRDRQVIACCGDKTVRVLALESGEELHRLEHPGPCKNADISPNKTLLAVACGSAVVIWDIRNAVKIEQFDLGAGIYDARFNPTGDKLVVGLYDGEVYIIELH